MRHTTRYVCAAIASVSWLLHGLPATAAVIGTYSDRATWEGLTTGRTDIDFESVDLPLGYASYGTASGLTLGGLQFIGNSGSDYQLYVINPPDGAPEDFDSNKLLRGPDFVANSFITVNLPANVTSFGLDLMTALPNAASFRIQLNGLDMGIVISTQARPNRTFFGFRTDTAITDLRFILDGTPNNNTFALIDNISYGMASISGGGGGGGGDLSETPEATTMLYVVTGFGLLSWARKRRKLAMA